MTVADRIRDKRNELSLSQSELASRAGYSDKTAISKIEHAGNDITMKQVKRIAKALNVSSAYLMGWQEQVEQVTKQLEPHLKQLSELGKQVSDSLSRYEIDTDKLFEAKINALTNKYSPEERNQALMFVTAFLKATPERQKIALEILQQSNQVDS